MFMPPVYHVMTSYTAREHSAERVAHNGSVI